MAQTYLMLLWHQHQPFYKDLAENRYSMPWVRLHALKDYYGMVAMLREFPSVHLTFNLVPSLIVQLEDYARETPGEEAYELAFKPAAELSAEERRRLLHHAFQANRENLIGRYRRFHELYEKARPWQPARGEAPALDTQDFVDLQVVSQLAWFDEIYLAQDADVRGVVERQRDYTENDKVMLRKKETELVQAVLEEHRAAQDRGQIEISTSPFYHPILPLLCDSSVAEESHPGVTLPRREFRHPEDARAQLRAALDLHNRVFGRRPQGLWPSEGSVSDAALKIAVEEGFRWAASDEGVLSRTLGVPFVRQVDGAVSSGTELYRPHRLATAGGELKLFFRDHEISDRIGFVYSRMAPEEAAADLHAHILAAGRSTGDRPAVVTVVLDGENAWEYYPGNGREFLKAFYRRLASDPSLRALTASEALDATEPGTLTHIVPGSWINANFDVWIGAEEDNLAWDLLSDARDFFADHHSKPGLDADKSRLAEQELWIAEGSDWCWWYGPEHSTPNDEEFDLLYRKHLGNIYHLLGGRPPDVLAVPIKRPRAEGLNVGPSARIAPAVDGKVTTYFEWLGAGVYSPASQSGAMHGLVAGVDALYYGYGESAFFLRLDLNPAFAQGHPDFEVRITAEGAGRARLMARVSRGELGAVALSVDDVSVPPAEAHERVQVALDRIFELRLDRAVLGDPTIRVQVAVWVNDLPYQVVPSEGWLTLEGGNELGNW